MRGIAIAALLPMLAFAAEPPAEPQPVGASPIVANYAADLSNLLEEDMRRWANKPIVTESLAAHSKATDYMSPAEARAMNAAWRSELKKNRKTLVTKTLENPLADYLRDVMRRGGGIYTEIIATDAKGVAVAMTSANSVYWQGKEECWLQTAEKKTIAPYIGPVKFSDDTGLFQADVAFAVFNEDKLIGMIRAGIDVERFDRRF